jgi:hypothetical protein
MQSGVRILFQEFSERRRAQKLLPSDEGRWPSLRGRKGSTPVKRAGYVKRRRIKLEPTKPTMFEVQTKKTSFINSFADPAIKRASEALQMFHKPLN